MASEFLYLYEDGDPAILTKFMIMAVCRPSLGVHGGGLIAYHYTLNTKWQMLLLRQFGSDGLFTDAANRVLKLFRGCSIALEQAFQKAGY